jgi:hypothetical protein
MSRWNLKVEETWELLAGKLLWLWKADETQDVLKGL